jgi:hypothetical protein
MVKDKIALRAVKASEVRVKLLAAKKFESDLLIFNGMNIFLYTFIYTCI